jgi:hypothetical protein
VAPCEMRHGATQDYKWHPYTITLSQWCRGAIYKPVRRPNRNCICVCTLHGTIALQLWDNDTAELFVALHPARSSLAIEERSSSFFLSENG